MVVGWTDVRTLEAAGHLRSTSSRLTLTFSKCCSWAEELELNGNIRRSPFLSSTTSSWTDHVSAGNSQGTGSFHLFANAETSPTESAEWISGRISKSFSSSIERPLTALGVRSITQRAESPSVHMVSGNAGTL